VYSGEKREFNAGQFVADLFTVGLEAVAFGGAAKGLRNAETASWCFVAGTLVATEDGQKPIEEIQAGDKVLSENPETGEVAYKTVEETYENETTELVHVFVNGEEIITTPSHPFYVPKLGWTLAIKLRAGDILVLSNGEYVVVEAIQHELLESPIKVYNFEVEDFHTYFVGESSVLVHNECTYSRVQGGDFKWTFNNSVDDESYDVNPALKAALISYETKLIKILGEN
jgi:intein/homing endonuclease